MHNTITKGFYTSNSKQTKQNKKINIQAYSRALITDLIQLSTNKQTKKEIKKEIKKLS